ncbi:HTH-type transcriptional activator IlvY [Parashewanella spongiae]|uniref:HTH-type transcriptional activator IlvY n=1 Tax=Parashewanella spongiae TaxID=342950 RepID=A0A3A6TYR7_9GAMM|nr:HTH-type transcriptional activator IlvY [Parashewanella spongiae]MCL1077720.1 HTH-type transcriptional activator IlvY [Parashewanella spongiae]RJY18078.1 HTH-type transcriptional activator IlvY [Parashewanella spongiae]
MDSKSVAMFHHLAKELHFGKTAAAFHLSPSTLSRAITRLEEELGCKLLIRNNRTAMLTPEGLSFKKFAEQQIEQLQLLKLSVNNNQTQLKGKLRLYCSVTAAYSHLPALLDQFREQHPLIEIMLSTGDHADALPKIQRQEVDLAIAVKPDNLATGYFFHHLTDVPLKLIAPTIICQVQQQLHQKTIDWSQIPIVLPVHGLSRSRFEKWFRSMQLGKPKLYATVSGHEAIVSMVALGCGVGIAPEVVVEHSPVKDRICSLNIDHNIAPFELGICCLSIRKKQPLINAFLESIK